MQGTSEPLSATEGHAGHGPHVPRPPAGTAASITWYPVTRRTDRVRVLRWTCECRLTVYYLVTGGGRAWIRRSVRTGPVNQPAVSETEPLRYREAGRLWDQILLGKAR